MCFIHYYVLERHFHQNFFQILIEHLIRGNHYIEFDEFAFLGDRAFIRYIGIIPVFFLDLASAFTTFLIMVDHCVH